MKVDEIQDYISKFGVRVLRENGIEEFFPPQVDAIKNGLFSRENMVIAIPTASGKTLIAELAMVYDVIKGGKCLYTVPLRALAMEKYYEFKKWEKIGIKTGLSIGDYESKDEWLGQKDIIVTTSEKADSLMRNRASWLSKLSCLVVDEIHLLDSAKRGATLEVLIAKLRKTNPGIRIIGLSATIPNADEIAEWLDARVIVSDWRPVPLYEGIFFNGNLEFYTADKAIRTKINGKDHFSLTLDSITRGSQVLIFESTRRNAESTAQKLSSLLFRYFKEKYSNKSIAGAILEENDGELSQKLADCVKMGVAFHHAGLLNSQRKIVEDAFREGKIKAVVSTPTLAAGVNLPAERVIIKSYYRFENFANQPIKVLEYKQMAGRAGRPGLDEKGEAILVVKNKSELEKVRNRYILGETEKIKSKLGAENHLRFHTLSIISEGYARTIEELDNFFSSTFFFFQNEISSRYELEKIVLSLERWEMVEFNDLISVKDLGELVSRLYIDPMTGHIFYEELIRKEKFSELDALLLLCRAPDMEILYVRKADSWLEGFLDEINYDIPYPDSVDFDWFLRELKTALLIRDWTNEVDEDEICKKYGISPGDIHRIIENAEWLTHSLFRISKFMKHSEKSFFEDLEMIVKFGVKEELVPLVDLKGIGRVRARKLFNAGIRSKEDILKNKNILPRIIGKKIAEKLINSIEGVQ